MFSSMNFVNVVKNPLSKIKASLKQFISKQQIEIIPIIPQKLYHISTPSQGNIQSLLEQFKTSNQFQLWNISQYSYGQEILGRIIDGRQRNSDGRQIVYNLTYQYFASIPFCEMIKSIQTIQAFNSLNPKNKVYIHCQENKRRSAIFLACYIFLTGIQTDIVTSILKVNKLLNISMQEKQVSQNSPGSIYKSQHIVLKNLMNYINNSAFINKNTWNLKKVLINNAPKIHDVLRSTYTISNDKKDLIKFKVLLQIRSVQGISYRKIFHDEFIEGQSLCLRMPQTQDIVLKDDFVIIIKYVYDKKAYSIIRTQLNTNFIYDQYFRVQRNDMDLSVNNAHSKNDTIFMDLLLQINPNQQSQLSKLNILKQNGQSQVLLMNQQQKKDTQSTYKTQISKQQKQEDEEDGFGILDQQQEAVHNQKMQRQIEQQLARELQKIRKKKNLQQQKAIVEQTVNENKSDKSTQKKQEEAIEPSKKVYQQKIQTQKEQQKLQSEEQGNTDQNLQQQKSAQKIEQKSQHNQQSEHSKQQQSGSESQQQSSLEQDQQQQDEDEQDLDDYLSKLEKQAERHD